MATPLDKARRRRLGVVGTILQAAILLAAIVYIAYGLAGQWRSLRQHEWTLRAAPFLLSLPLAAGWFACRAWLWQRLLASLGHAVQYRRAFRTWVLSELARYVPGKIWMVLGRSYLSARDGVPPAIVLTAMAFELVLVAVSATAFFLVRATTPGPLPQIPWAKLAAAALLVAALAHPRIVTPAVNFALRRLKQPPITVRLPYSALLAMAGLCALMWLCLCLGFVLLVASITQVEPGHLIGVASSFAGAWVIALVSFVAPAGLGVREGILAALLGGLVPQGMAFVAALASRVWLTGVELVCAAIAWQRAR